MPGNEIVLNGQQVIQPCTQFHLSGPDWEIGEGIAHETGGHREWDIRLGAHGDDRRHDGLRDHRNHREEEADSQPVGDSIPAGDP